MHRLTQAAQRGQPLPVPAVRADGIVLAVVQAAEQQGLRGEARPGGQQAFELALLLELIEAAQGGDHALARASGDPMIFDDL